MSGPTSIVIPCHDNLLYTALCLESIARHTPEPHEVIVVVVLNNDALATPGWLTGLRGALDREPGAGIAGPRSNWVSDDQIIASPPYHEAPSEELDRSAGRERGALRAQVGAAARPRPARRAARPRLGPRARPAPARRLSLASSRLAARR